MGAGKRSLMKLRGRAEATLVGNTHRQQEVVDGLEAHFGRGGGHLKRRGKSPRRLSPMLSKYLNCEVRGARKS